MQINTLNHFKQDFALFSHSHALRGNAKPYRFVIERHVTPGNTGDFDGTARKQLLGFVQQAIKLNGAGYRLPSAINESIASFVRVLDGRTEHLHLPQDVLPPKDSPESWA
ncbi:hypothetical protein [Methyloglobulus sp.]|uniref:hypothetical protein n=1 Tax=Methyloglobulus sp. TaxID=2518622 RepID=UPI00398957BC